MNVTIKDVAHKAGVGLGTVSRVINNNPGVRKSTKQKVEAVIKELGYVPNNSARDLKRTQTNRIGLIVKGIGNPFFLDAVLAIESKISQGKYSIITLQIDKEEYEVDIAASFIKEKRLCGVIILGGVGDQDEERIKVLKETGAPCVFVSVPINGCEILSKYFTCLTIDDTKSAFYAIDYLCSLSHEKILILTAEYSPNSVSDLRTLGYKNALEKNNIKYDNKLLVDAKAFTIKDGYEAMKNVIKQKLEYTAIFALSDALAIGATKALLENGYNVPKDISVMGFDGMEIMKYYHPSISTISQPIYEMSKDSVDILIKSIESQPVKKIKIYETTLSPASSTSQKIQNSINF